MNHKNIADLVRENKTVFIIIAVVLFLIELEIFAVAAMKAGRKQWLQILDKNGNVIHVTDGKNLSEFNKYYFEKTFGRSLDEFDKRLEIKDEPFPFRAWLTAAVGIPIGVILLFAFTVKAYISLFYGGESRNGTREPENKTAQYDSEFEKVMGTLNSFNIFTIGFLILLSVFMYWVLPNMVSYIAKVSVDTLVRFKWVVICAALVLVGLFAWIVYLRYLLAKRNIDNQSELEKIRLQLEYSRGVTPQPQLEYHHPRTEGTQLVTWEEKKDAENEEAVPERIHPENLGREIPNNT
ncbi:MAG: hypothetical protein R2941_25745 [Desulfobacterales bacterium]